MTWTAFVDRSNCYLPFLDLYCRRRRLKPIIVRPIRCGRSFVQTSLPHHVHIVTCTCVQFAFIRRNDLTTEAVRPLSPRFVKIRNRRERRRTEKKSQRNTEQHTRSRKSEKTAKWNEKKTFHFNLLAAADQLRLRSSSVCITHIHFSIAQKLYDSQFI